MKKILIIFSAFLLLCAGADAQSGRQNYVIGFYNLENLFDIYDDPVKNDAEFLPEGKNKWTEAKYQKTFEEFALCGEPEATKLGGKDAMAYTYTYRLGGVAYKSRQVIAVYSAALYSMTYTALPENFDAHLSDVNQMIDAFEFR